MSLRVLLVEDSEDDVVLLRRELLRGGFEPAIERVDTSDAMAAALAEQVWDAVICDYNMPEFSAPAALALLQGSGLDIPFIVVSGAVGEDAAVAMMKAGAHDYIMKDNLTRLVAAIERELREAELRRERKLLENQLLQSQKMEAVGSLAGGVAHDFNNLLMPILGYTEMALKSQTLEDRTRGQLQEVHKAASRASDLVRQLLAFSRQDVVDPKVLDLNQLIAGMNNMMRRLIGEDVEMTIQAAPDLGLVKADPGRMEQVLLNLVVNARDAMPGGGKLVIETSNVVLSQEDARRFPGLDAGSYVMLAVRDSGTGMTEEVKARIFEPFFTTKEVGKGTGLGLSTCYGIITQSGGSISVDTKPGHGTTFRICLPRIEDIPTLECPQSESAAAPGSGKEMVLLAEDEKLVREVTA